MRNSLDLRTILGAGLAALLCLASTWAQAQGLFRAYLSSSGNDANPCTLQSPCRLLPAAINAVQAFGEIWMVDSANYNTATVSVTKTVKILAVPGVVGSIVATGGPAIDSGTSGVTILLKNVVIAPLYKSGTTTGTSGIVLFNGASVVLEDSVITGVPLDGISLRNAGSSAYVINSTVRDVGRWAVLFENGAIGSIAGSKIINNGRPAGNYGGVRVLTDATAPANSNTTVNISDSLLSGNNEAILVTNDLATGNARAVLTRSTIDRASTDGLAVESTTGTASVVLSGSLITNSHRAFAITGVGSKVRSLGNNHIRDNEQAPVGSLEAVAPM